MARLVMLREAGSVSAEHIRLAAAGHGVDERTVRRWLARADQTRPARPVWYQLLPADREAFAYFRGNVTAIARARAAVLAGQCETAGVPVPEFLVAGWARARVAAPRAAGLGGLAGGALLMEDAGVGDDGAGACRTSCRSAATRASIKWEAESAEPSREGAVGEGLPGELAGEQPPRFLAGADWQEHVFDWCKFAVPRVGSREPGLPAY